MFKRLIIIVLFCIIGGVVLSQDKVKIDLKKQRNLGKKNQEFVQNEQNGFIIKEEISVIELSEKETKEGFYRQLFSEGMSKTFDAGKPDLPVINRLIEIPQNHTVAVKFISYDEEIINLKDYGLTKLIFPAQPSFEKSKNPKNIPFYKDEEVYSANEFYSKETVKIEDIGYLRDKHLGYIEISPFSYNPVTNTLKVLNNIEVSVEFIPEKQKRYKTTEQLASPYFNNINYQTINKTTESKSLITGPVKYVIISDRMFEEALQPFIEWKTQKGFIVVEAYTDVIGINTTDIQAYLQDLYDNPGDGIPPTFGLLVGDVDQVPTFSGTAGNHKTDLYYFEYTGDKLPEVFYGRFSAESVEELQPQIDKTLEVEKYEMPDPSYLDNVVLVAGVDGSYAPTHGNGAINYANSYYTNSGNDITSYYYLYDDDSGVMSSNNSGASASIRNYISQGVSFSNYTAHCGSSGWSDPSFSINHIDGLTNEHMYPLMIGNCCQSNTFVNDDCFGEEILMAANKGAVGYIGGSNLTYWDEDYYWAIGLTGSITANPTYEGSELGAYDRFFHLNGEAKEDWYITQGQISVAGNLAVQASTSSRKAYYWEIYHLMGDPSLTPFVTVPASLVATYNEDIIVGYSGFQVNAEENSYVALSQNGVLLDAQLVDASGTIELSFDPISEVGTADIVITKQNRQPIIDQINVVPSSTPYVLLDYYIIDDETENNDLTPDYGETIKLDIQLKNLSDDYDALNVRANLTTSDTNVIISDGYHEFGSIPKSDSLFIEGTFTVQIKNRVTDQHNIVFEVEVIGEDLGSIEYSWISKFRLAINAPELEITDVQINDLAGNNNGILDPGETGDIELIVKNVGNSFITDLVGTCSLLGEGSLHLTINDGVSESFSLDAGKTDTISFNVTANSETAYGTVVYKSFIIDDQANQYYTITEDKEISVGEIPNILITDNDTSIVNKGYFYDSGGSTGNYSNYENDTITIRPYDAGDYINIEFLEFNIEADGSGCYDYLEIYDGVNTEAGLIGSYCDSNVPTSITATNPDGALTFRFYSDYSLAYQGWEAEITTVQGTNYNLFITVSDLNGPVQGAIVDFDGQTDTTDINGEAEFINIPEGINYPVSISAIGYESLQTTLNIFENSNEDFTLEILKYDITFNLFDQDSSVEGDVVFNGLTLSTTNGSVTFEDVEYGLSKECSIQSYGCETKIDTIDVASDLSVDVVLNAIKYDIGFIISDGIDPVQNAIIEFDDRELSTDVNGLAQFEQVKMDTMLTYIVRKTDYDNIEGTVNVLKDSTISLTLIGGKAYYKVCFEVNRESNPVYNAEVILNSDTLFTDNEGLAIFEDVEESENITYKITKPHFNVEEGIISLSGNNITIVKDLTYTSYEIIFRLTDNGNPVADANITFDEISKLSDSSGESIFELVYSLNRTYQITMDGYDDNSGMINVDENKVVDILMVPTGIDEVEEQNVKIYPNPSSGQFIVEINDINNNLFTIRIFNIIGSIVYAEEVSGHSYIREQIDISQYAKGMYFISIESKDGMIISKRILIR